MTPEQLLLIAQAKRKRAEAQPAAPSASNGAGMGPVNPMVAMGLAAQDEAAAAGVRSEDWTSPDTMRARGYVPDPLSKSGYAKPRAPEAGLADTGNSSNLLNDIGRGLVAPLQVNESARTIVAAPLQFGHGLGQGVQGFGNNVAAVGTDAVNSTLSLADPSREQFARPRVDLFDKNVLLDEGGLLASDAGIIPRAVGQFSSVRMPLGKASPYGGFGHQAAKDAAAFTLSTDHRAPRLSDMISSETPVIGPVADLLRSNENDPAIVSMMKNLGEDLSISAVTAGLLKLIDGGYNLARPSAQAGKGQDPRLDPALAAQIRRVLAKEPAAPQVATPTPAGPKPFSAPAEPAGGGIVRRNADRIAGGVVGATVGGVGDAYAADDGEGNGGPLNAGTGATIGFFGPRMVASAASRGFRAAARPFRPAGMDERVAARAVRNALASGGIRTPEEAAAAFTARYGDKPASIADLTQEGVSTAAGLSRRSGATGEAARARGEDLIANRAGRLFADIEGTTGIDPAVVTKTIDDLIRSASEEISPAYEALFDANRGVNSERLMQLADDPIVGQYVRSAIKEAESLQTTAGQAPSNARTWDLVKRGLDRTIKAQKRAGGQASYALEKARAAVKDELDALMPDYKAVRDGADAPRMRDARRQGGRVMSGRVSVESVKRIASGLTGRPLTAMQAGMIEQIVPGIEKGQGLAGLASTRTEQALSSVFGEDVARQLVTRVRADAAIVNNATRMNPNVGSVTSQAQMGEGGFLPMAAEAIRAVRSPIEATLAAMSKGGSYSQAQRDLMGQMLLEGATPENLARIFGNRGGRRGGNVPPAPPANALRTGGNPPPSGPATPPPEQAGFIRNGILAPVAGAGAGATLNPIDANQDGVIDDADRWGNAAGGALSAAILGKTASTIGNRLAKAGKTAPKAPAGRGGAPKPPPAKAATDASDPFGDKAWAAQKKMGAGKAQAVEPVDTSTWTPSDFQAARNQLRTLQSERKTAPAEQWLDYDTEIAQLKQALNQDAPSAAPDSASKPPPDRLSTLLGRPSLSFAEKGETALMMRARGQSDAEIFNAIQARSDATARFKGRASPEQMRSTVDDLVAKGQRSIQADEGGLGALAAELTERGDDPVRLLAGPNGPSASEVRNAEARWRAHNSGKPQYMPADMRAGVEGKLKPGPAGPSRPMGGTSLDVNGVLNREVRNAPASASKPPPVKSGFGGSSKLPMDEGSRMARAREMGFDVDFPVFHGSRKGAGFDEFQTSERGRFGPGVYFSEQPGVAGKYGEAKPYVVPTTDQLFDAMPRWNSLTSDAEQRIIKQLRPHEKEKLLARKDWYKREGEAFWEALRRAVDGEDGVLADARASEVIQAAGFKGIRGIGDGQETVIFDPKNVRRTDATFDPSQEGSSKLLAGVRENATGLGTAGGAIAGGALARDTDGDGVVSASERAAQALGGAVTGGVMGAGFNAATRRMGKAASGNALRGKGAPAIDQAGIKAYHGSPHDFDKFDSSKIGTGEGAQSYGRGLYFAENEAVAKGYRDALSPAKVWKIDPSKIPDEMADFGFSPKSIEMARRTLEDLNGDGFQAISALDGVAGNTGSKTAKEAAAVIRSFNRNVKQGGRLYEVDINAEPDDFLDWDKPLSEQSAKVQNAYNASVKPKLRTREIGNNPNLGNLTDVYIDGSGSLGVFTKDQIADVMENPAKYSPLRGDTMARDEAFTASLREAGIPGIKYLDQGSRGAADGTRNYVVFDDSAVNIINKAGFGGGGPSRPNPPNALKGKPSGPSTASRMVAGGVVGGLAGSLGGDAQAQEDLTGKITETEQTIAELKKAMADLDKITDPFEKQRKLKDLGYYAGKIDGNIAGKTTEGMERLKTKREADLAKAESELKDLMRRDALQRNSPNPYMMALRDYGPTLGFIGGVLGVKFLRGKAATASVATAEAASNRLNKFITKGPVTGPLNKRDENRFANLNTLWKKGGATKDQLPFKQDSVGKYKPNPNAKPAEELFSDNGTWQAITRYVKGKDIAIILGGGVDVAYSQTQIDRVSKDLEKAEKEWEDNPSNETFKRVEDLKNEKAGYEFLQRLGAGIVGGRILGTLGNAYAKPMPNIPGAASEQAKLKQYIAAQKPPPKPRAPRNKLAPPPPPSGGQGQP